MGVYNVSVQEIIDEITQCLDEIEGDFRRKDLNQALSVIRKEYKYVSDED